jgi:alcohol dehydrogenase class IV
VVIDYQAPRTRIVAGIDSHRQLPGLLDSVGSSGAFVICGGTVGRGPQLAAVRSVLGERLVGVYDEVRPHGGDVGLLQAAKRVRASGAGAVISIGGGAVIDSAKFVVLALSTPTDVRDHCLRKIGQPTSERAMLTGTAVAHIAIPTTTGSSSEVMPSAGIRDAANREKVLYRDPLLVPDLAVLDPILTVETGPELTATSGATAIARSIEALYSLKGTPFTAANAVLSLRLMNSGLPASIENGADLDARHDALLGSVLSGFAANGAGAALVHAIGHAVAGMLALQHGIAHRIVLPPVARLLLPHAQATPAQLADALGSEVPRPDMDHVAVLLGELLDRLPMPARLREVGVSRDDLDELAARTAREPMMHAVPGSFSVAEIRALLEECW